MVDYVINVQGVFGILIGVLIGAAAATISPYAGLFVAVSAIIGIFAYSTFISKKLNPLVLGIIGEKKVGDNLLRLEWRGCRVIHDIQRDRSNIDHLVIAPGGLFVIETKYRSKKGNGQNEVRFDGDALTINGLPDLGNAKGQVCEAANYITTTIKALGEKAPVTPIICFPGWWVESVAPNKQVHVLNETSLVSWIDKTNPVLENADINRLYAKLSDKFEPERSDPIFG